LYDISIDLEPTQQIGDIGRGTRLIVCVRGGTFSGPRLRGRVLPGGGDWITLRADGTAELDVRATLETDDGALIYVSYRGYVHNVPAILPRWGAGETIAHQENYFLVTPYYETSAPQYAWLTETIAVGVGSLIPGGVSYRVVTVR
jgi:hypothetical protein